MPNSILSLKHVPSNDTLFCTGCGADFVPSEDSGSRVLSVRTDQMSLTALLCGGCHSKWSHGAALTLRGPLQA